MHLLPSSPRSPPAETRARTVRSRHARAVAGNRALLPSSKSRETGCAQTPWRRGGRKANPSGEFNCYAEPPSSACWHGRAVCPNHVCLFPARRDHFPRPSEMDTKHTHEKPNGSPIMMDANTTGQQPMFAAGVMVIAMANNASSQTCLRCRAGCKLSAPVGVCALNEVMEMVRREHCRRQQNEYCTLYPLSKACDCRSMLDPTMCQTSTVCHRRREGPGFPCSCPQARFDKPLACRFAAPPAVWRPITAPGFDASFATTSISQVGRASSAIAGCISCVVCCRLLCQPSRGFPCQHTVQGPNLLHKQIPERSLSSRRKPWPWSSPDQQLLLPRGLYGDPTCAFSSSTMSYCPRTSDSTVRPRRKTASHKAVRSAASR